MGYFSRAFRKTNNRLLQMIDVMLLAAQCAPNISPQTLSAIVKVESSQNPYSIGVVDGYLVRQPKSKQEAIATAHALRQGGWNFSMGMAQINLHNLPKYNLSFDQVFEPCDNLRVAADIFNECYQRALAKLPTKREALLASYSCYYSGNFTRGFKPEGKNNTSYVDRILAVTLPSVVGDHSDTLAIPVISTRSTPKKTNERTTPSSKKIDQQSARVSYHDKVTRRGIKEFRGDE